MKRYPSLALLALLLGCTNNPPPGQTVELNALRDRVAKLEQQNTQLKGELDELRKNDPFKSARFELTLDPAASANSSSQEAYTVVSRPNGLNRWKSSIGTWTITGTGEVRADVIQVGTLGPATKPATQPTTQKSP